VIIRFVDIGGIDDHHYLNFHFTINFFFFRKAGDDNKMLVCDTCDKGYHTYCLKPVMTTIPKNGWKCKVSYLPSFLPKSSDSNCIFNKKEYECKKYERKSIIVSCESQSL